MAKNKLSALSPAELDNFRNLLLNRYDYCEVLGGITHKVTGGSRSGKYAGTCRGGYTHVSVDGALYYCHQLVWLMKKGRVAQMLDHIDNDKSNNLVENLRECTTQENNRNKTGREPHTGIHVVHNKYGDSYVASIGHRGASIHLGTFANIGEAVQARADAEVKYFGEFAPNA